MKRIILASASPQRRKLLSLLGIKFSVVPARVNEIQKVKTNCADLVKENALLKAEEVASRLKRGVIIGSDTLVFCDGKVIGKSKNLKEARKVLKLLASKPAWVYSGVAIIDVKSGWRLLDYEKTKIYMLALSDEEINSYHKRVNPLDKAGGFDIEGLGSIFIHRIEGCYSNVIGLPMAKLAHMLKKVGVKIL